MSAALAERERRLGGLNVGLVAIPGHLARRTTDVPEQLCRRICRRLPWLQHEPGALQRIVSVRRSRTSADRRFISEHLQSLAFARQPPARWVILIDDVFTFGRVTEAASRLVLDAGATNVVIACLAKTRL
jgi:predicted amidophosphoribosyltransferase